MKTLSRAPHNTPWRYYDARQTHAEQFRKFVDFEEFTARSSLKRQPIRLNAFSWLVIFGVGWAGLFVAKLMGWF